MSPPESRSTQSARYRSAVVGRVCRLTDQLVVDYSGGAGSLDIGISTSERAEAVPSGHAQSRLTGASQATGYQPDTTVLSTVTD